MKAGRAFFVGVIGALVMTIMMWLARTFMGMPANLEMMLGTMFGGPPDSTRWVIGFVWHLLNGGIFALVYAYIFEHFTHRAGWAVGAGLGFVHAIVAGLFMAMMPMMHPLIKAGEMPSPGAFMANLGAIGIIAEFVLHLVFGAIVGGMYGAVLHPREHEPHGTPRPAH